MSSSKLIDGDKLTAFERWELPVMGAQKASARRGIEEMAEEEAAALQPLTAEQLEAISQQAHDEGFEQGLREGREAAKQELEAAVQRLEQVIAAFAEPLQAVDEQVEEELLALAMAVAGQIIRREIQQDPGHIVAAVREALAALPSAARRVRIALHPEDAELVRQHMPQGDDEERSWQITEDLSLTRGGCRIQSETSRIDATLEKRLNAILNELLGGTRRGVDDEQH